MTSPAITAPVINADFDQSRSWTGFLRHSFAGRIGLALTLLLFLLAIFAPWIAPRDPIAQDLPARLLGPGPGHWMGTDELGRDVMSRVLFGARISILVGVSVVAGASLVGVLLGAIAGYFGGWLDRIINSLLTNAFLSFPGILLAIAFAAFLGAGIGKVILALIITGWAGYARLARAQVLKTKEMDYVLAARSLGASHARILLRHIMPNAIQPVMIQMSIGMAGAILAESTLSFLGLGVLSPAPSWGAMLNDASYYLFSAPHLVIFPALAIMAAVLGFNLLGDALRDWLDPKMQSQLITLSLTR
ncbi:MAG TPA: ABC transporter permease [Candidatus Acidoferrum sp.]|nr:ABC transporter permease [Candidatus Acidoferrum sp.]